MKKLLVHAGCLIALTFAITACGRFGAVSSLASSDDADSEKVIDITNMTWEEIAKEAAQVRMKSSERACDLYKKALDKTTEAKAPPKKILTLLYNYAEILSLGDSCKEADVLYQRGVDLAHENKIADWEAAFLVRQSLNEKPLVQQGLKKSLDTAPIELALKLRPGQPEVPTEFRGLAYIALGRANEFSKKYGEAEKDYLLARDQFAAAGTLDERVRNANENLLRSYVAQGKFKEANKLFVAVGKSEPAYRWHYLYLYRNNVPRDTVDNPGITEKVRLLLTTKDFDGLDAYAAELHKTKQPFASGYWPMDKMIADLECNKGANDKVWQERIDFCKKWLAHNPKSTTARIAMAVNYAGWAWHARGGGYADTVSEEGWKLFGERLKDGQDVLAEVQDRPGEYYWVWQRIAMGLSLDDEETVAEALKKFPGYTKIIGAKFYRLQPRWGGGEGDDMRFLDSQISANPGVAGEMLYERAALEAGFIFTNVFADGHFNKARVKKGAEAIRKAIPASQVARAISIFLAMEANDMPTAEAIADGRE